MNYNKITFTIIIIINLLFCGFTYDSMNINYIPVSASSNSMGGVYNPNYNSEKIMFSHMSRFGGIYTLDAIQYNNILFVIHGVENISNTTEAWLNVDDDGLVTVAGANTEKCNEAVELVKAITFEPEVGMEFDGKVTRLMSFGAFVEFAPGREGMVHISELEWHRVEKVEDVLKSGDEVRVKLIKVVRVAKRDRQTEIIDHR